MPEFSIFLFDSKHRKINKLPQIVNGETLNGISKDIIKHMEAYPLGNVSSILVYDNHGEYAARYTVQDYLNSNIPKKS